MEQNNDQMAHDSAVFINSTVNSVYELVNSIPGSHLAISYLKNAYQNDPFRVALELFLVFFAIKYMLSRKYTPNDNNIVLTEKEVDDLVKEWQPEPLTPSISSFDQFNLKKVPVIVGAQGAKVKVHGHPKPLMNLATTNYLNLADSERIREKAIDTLKNYGVGSCGPPGFYGTIDVHADLEKKIACFLGTESAIIYSQGFSTISSVIPAFAKRGDFLVVDEGCSFAIQKGVQISRSIIHTFKHNDMEDLRRVLEKIHEENKGKRLTRRFIVTEGLFANYGDIAPLDKLIELKKEFKYRLILDESQSIGVIGKRGAGLTDLFNINANEVDILSGSLCNAICSSGGFCAGSEAMIDHQRLSGSSYCFSASMPAMLAVSAIEAFNMIEEQPALLKELTERIRLFREVLKHKSLEPFVHFEPSDESFPSPFFHIRVNDDHLEADNFCYKEREPREAEETLLQDVVDECAYQGVLVTRAKYVTEQEQFCPRPSIKICITTGLTQKENDKAASVVKAAIVKVFGKSIKK